jgi:hypothetical protein
VDDELGTGRCAVRFPEVAVGEEIEESVRDDQVGGVTAGGPGFEVAHENRARRGAVGPPELGPVDPVVGREVEHAPILDAGHVFVELWQDPRGFRVDLLEEVSTWSRSVRGVRLIACGRCRGEEQELAGEIMEAERGARGRNPHAPRVEVDDHVRASRGPTEIQGSVP